MHTLSKLTPRLALPTMRPSARNSALAQAERFGRALWTAFEDFGHRRAARELLAIAERVQARDPDLARTLRAASWFNPRG